MNALGRIISIGLIVGGAPVSSDRKTVAAAPCPTGTTDTNDGRACMPMGRFDCGNGFNCPYGKTCGEHGACLGGKQPRGPMCSNGVRCIESFELCAPNGGCYNPKVTYLCGAVGCLIGRKYPAGHTCDCLGGNRQSTSKRPSPDTMKDAVADTLKKQTKSAVRGLSVREAVRDAHGEWTCVGISGFPDGPITNSSRWEKTFEHYCMPSGSVHCSFAAQSYACPPGSACFGDGTLTVDEECRPLGPLPAPH
jgi:hypothetical protein